MCRSSSWVWLISDGVAPAETSTIWFMPRCNVIGMRIDAPRIGTGVVVPFALASITCPFSGTEPGFARAEIAAGSLRGETTVIVTGGAADLGRGAIGVELRVWGPGRRCRLPDGT